MMSDRTGRVMATEDDRTETVVDREDGRTVTRRSADDTTIDGRSVGRAQVDDRRVSAPADAEMARDRTGTVVPERTGTVVDDGTDAVVPVGPRPRASLLATVSLILGVASVLALLTGVLPGPGVALGALAALTGIGGLSATSRRHVAGKFDALLGIALGLVAVVLGLMALTGYLPWLNADSDRVMQLRDWLDAHLPWLFPSA